MRLISSVKGQLILAAIGVPLFLISIPVANWTRLAFLPIIGFGVFIASGWLLLLHALGLILSVGHLLSLRQRAAFYFLMALTATVLVSLAIRISIAKWLGSVACVIVLTSVLVYADFTRFPLAPASGHYSPLDVWIARAIRKYLWRWNG